MAEAKANVMDMAKRASEGLSQKLPVQAVYLFGSHVTGKTHEWSDIDIGVFIKKLERQPFKKQLQSMVDIQREYSDDLEFHLFDVEDLTNAESCSFAAEVLRTGIRIY